MILFDFDAEGMTDLECENYAPQDMDVIGNLRAAQVAIERFNTIIIFNGNEYEAFADLSNAVAKVLAGNEA